MTKEDIIEIFKRKPYLLDMGANKIANQIKADVDMVRIARSLVRGKQETKKVYTYSQINKPGRMPKILIFDIETAPLKAYVWSRWKQNIYLDQTISEWFMISWSAKWLYGNEIFSDVLTPEEILSEDDKRISYKLWDLINEADVVVAHNGGRFDLPKINTRFLLNGLPPTTPVHMIDTKVIAAKQFGFSSNKLDALARYFGFDVKLDTDFDLWIECMNGSKTALAYMKKYNEHDTELLEEVYLKLRPWIKAHVNLGVYLESDSHVCGNCGSTHLHFVNNYYTNTGKYDVYRCNCGALSRTRSSSLAKNVSKKLLTTNMQ